jgi:GNAT superfamily N-acetyltransferase
MSISIRNATLHDADAIAVLHATVWRATYQSLAPAAALAALTTQVRLARWRVLLGEPAAGQVTLLAEHEGALAGFGQLAPPSPQSARREIRFLYVGEAHQGCGVGRGLMRALAQAALDQGAAGIELGVVDGNARAIAFYQRLGGQRVGRYTDPGPIWRSDNLVYAWDDLAALACP